MKIKDQISKLEKTVAARRGAQAVSEAETSWGEHIEYLIYHRSFKALKRLRKILRLAPGLRCPDCGYIKTRPKQWVVVPGQELATCLACYRKHYMAGKRKRAPHDPYKIPGPLVISEIVYYLVDKVKLREARMRAGLSGEEFCELAGWNRYFQDKLERDSCILNKSQLNRILKVLENFGVTFV